MEGHCSTGQSPQWAVVPMEEEDNVCLFYLEFKKLRITQNIRYYILKINSLWISNVITRNI